MTPDLIKFELFCLSVLGSKKMIEFKKKKEVKFNAYIF